MSIVILSHKREHNILGDLASGIRAPFAAIPFILRRKILYPLLFILFIINGAILCGSVYIVFTQLYPLLKNLIPTVDNWYMILITMIGGAVISLVTLFCGILLYALVGTLITSPFLDALSNSTEKNLSGEKVKGGGFLYPFAEIGRILMMFLRGLIVVVVFFIILFPLNLIPFAGNLLYSFLCLAAVGFFAGSPFYSYPLDRREAESSSKMSLLLKYKWEIVGSGIAFFIISFIPVLGFLSHAFISAGSATVFREKILPYVEFSHPDDEK